MAFRGFGKHVNYIATSNAASLQQKNIVGNVSSTFTDEFFLADGQTAALEAINGGYPIKHYNLMVIPEGN